MCSREASANEPLPGGAGVAIPSPILSLVEGRSLDAFPSISVVVPVRNRPAEIKRCLDSLTTLDYPAERLEIIIVDDASTDETPVVVREYPARNVSLVAATQHRGQSACRNDGAERGAGDVIAFIDSDCTADAKWLLALVPDLEEPYVVAAGGSVRESNSRGWLKRYEASLSPLNMGEAPARVLQGSQVEFLPSCNVLIRRTAFREVGGFDPDLRFGEDVDLIWRLMSVGEVRYRPDGIVWHDHRGRLGAFVKNRIRYASAQAVFLSRHGNRRRLDLPVGLLAGFILAVILSFVSVWFLAAALVGSVVEAIQGLLFGGVERARRVVAGYASTGYRAMTLVGRQYAIPLAAISAVLYPFWRWAPLGMLIASVCILSPAVIEWLRRRPRLDPGRFLLAFVIDTLSVGIGTVAGSIKHRTLAPLAISIHVHVCAVNVPPSKAFIR
ncbi:MAG: mycofactocin biosynthesis glycosyltransferase MftF [Actinomycetota bacterium]